MNSLPPLDTKVDLRDPRIRITFADVAMRVARDGPMYGVILLVGILAMKGTTTAAESIIGAAIALLARSHPPPEPDKRATLGSVAIMSGLVIAGGAAIAACV